MRSRAISRAAVRVGLPLGLRRYEVRNLATGRAPMCGEAAMLEVGTDRARAGCRDHRALARAVQEYVRCGGVPPRDGRGVSASGGVGASVGLPGLIVFGFRKPGATEATAPEFSSAIRRDEIVEWLAEAGGAGARGRTDADDRARADLLVRQRSGDGGADRAQRDRRR